MSRGSEQTFFQVRHTDGQQAHEKGSTLQIIKETNQNHNAITSHLSEWLFSKRQQISVGNNKAWKKGNPLELLVYAKLLQSCPTLQPYGL